MSQVYNSQGDKQIHERNETHCQATMEQTSAVTRASRSATINCKGLYFGQLLVDDRVTHFENFYNTSEFSNATITFDFDRRREINVRFRHYFNTGRYEVFSLCLYLHEIDSPIIKDIDTTTGTTTLLFNCSSSFRLFHRRRSGTPGVSGVSWFRCSELTEFGSPEHSTTGPVCMYHNKALFEVGRCNAFRVSIAPAMSIENQPLATAMSGLALVNLDPCSLRRRMKVQNLSTLMYKSLWRSYYMNQESIPFEVLYLLEAALSLHNMPESKLDTIIPILRKMQPSTAAEEILQQIVYMGNMVLDPVTTIKDLYQKGAWRSVTKELIPEYCVKLHRVVITATSMIVLPASMEVSNRILRQYSLHIDRFLRVHFLEDLQRGKLEGQSPTIASLYERILRTLIDGLHVGGRHYRFLAFGNSQLREHGSFFFSNCAGTHDCGVPQCSGLTARQIREDIGDVSEILIVAKQAARVGQAFSTTRVLRKNDNNFALVRIDDMIGGSEDKFCFSDGVGMISNDLLTSVARSMDHIGAVPSAFQFRLGGAKGVLAAIPPKLQHVQPYAITSPKILLRPSQSKFRSDHDSLEVVRVAKYGSAFLNRQFITTLWTLGVEKEVFLDFQRAMIEELDMGMLHEKIALKCLRKHVDEHGSSVFLSEMVKFGFMRRGDPFVNRVLQLFRNWSLKLLKEKAKISVEKGCFLMGVVDETQSLRGHYDSMYDQNDGVIDDMDLPEIFVQITDPDNPTGLRVVESVCIIGRAPALHPGDLRLVRAVDKPELRYLSNVLVFPARGDQDVASMCSGGDLDGDDYTIIWDRLLLPAKGHRYEHCMNYEGPKPKVVDKITLRMVFEFMIDFMKNNSLGQIANAHLAFAHDPVGTRNGVERRNCRAFSDQCMQLAELHSIAVDFVKTGIPAQMPRSLSRDSFPDFMARNNQDSFVSNTPLSLLYRDITASSKTYELSVNYDKTLCDVPNMLEWIDTACDLKKRYDLSLTRLMSQYGVKTEAEIVTGFILSYDTAHSGKNEYSMRTNIAQKYAAIRSTIRAEVQKLADTDENGNLQDSALAENRKEAIVAAMYDVTFSDILEVKSDVAMMSFPWVEHEVLGRLSLRRLQKNRAANTKAVAVNDRGNSHSCTKKEPEERAA